MPVVFAQPDYSSFNSRSSGGGGGGGNIDSSALADIAAFKAQYGDRQFNAEAQQQANVVGAQLQAHAAAQEQAAQLQMQTWMQQQAFTQSDQQELSRQQNALSEIMDKHDKGLITTSEMYQMAGQKAGRINFLTAKQQHTNNLALNEQRQQRAGMWAEQQKQMRLKDSILSGELENRVETHIPDDQKGFMADHMAKYFPELQASTPAYDAKMKLEAADMGVGTKMVKQANGNFVSLDSLLAKVGLKPSASGKGYAPASGEASDAFTEGVGGLTWEQRHKIYADAHDRAFKQLTTKDPATGHATIPDPDAVSALTDKLVGKELSFHQQGFDKAANASPMGVFKSSLKDAETKLQGLKQRPDMNIMDKSRAMNALQVAKTIIQDYPPNGKARMPKVARDRLNKAMDLYEQLTKQGEPAPAPATVPAAQPGGVAQAQPPSAAPNVMGQVGQFMQGLPVNAGGQ